MAEILWYMDENGDLRCPEMPYAPEKNMSKPYPSALWRIDEKISDLPYHELMPLEIPAGAFMGAKNLEYARIPETVRKIGRYAFADTALKKIKISSECEYYETSFPENCEVEFYGQNVDEHSGQLYDNNNNILIDIDGARVYVQELFCMADDIRRLRHNAEEIDDAIDILLEVYIREEIDEKFSGITEEITAIKNRLTFLETQPEEADILR